MRKIKKICSRILHYAGYVWPVKRYLILALISGLIAASASGFGIPVLIYKVFPAVFDPTTMPQPILDFISAYVSPENLGKAVLFTACAAMPLIFVVRGIAMWINAMAVNYFGMRVLENLRVGVFAKLQQLPLAFHEKQMRGDILSRIVTDAQNVQNMITQVSSDIVKQPLTAVCAIAALIYVLSDKAEASMFVASAVFAGVALAPILIFGKRVARKARGAQKNIGEMTAVVQENLAAQREIRSYAMEKTQVERMARTSNRFCLAQLKTIKYQQLLTPTLEFLTALALAFVLVRGRLLGMELTDFMAIAGALFFAADAIKRTGVSFNKFSQAQASLERLEEILTETDSIPDPENPLKLEKASGDIEFRNVGFAYENGRQVLSDINVRIPAGQTVALVGPSGAGKTTFASLILRFYEASSGAVLIDGIDVRRLKKENLRQFIALVSQHAVLFRDTIRENIRLGREGASDEDVERAARDAAAEDFTLKADGLDKKLGDVGSGVSGGQRQRLAIARAFLKDAPILILDEATAALDSESEKKIQDRLEHLARGRTTFIVAHRFSSIRIAQRILVFSQGRIVGDGTHETLYRSCALYKELYDRQGV
ncbi:MAG: ABC transporter ATP-binding protein [Opitutales bacterium]|nr:ABC transporter ATP-binding protein [Opitutales bacterium]